MLEKLVEEGCESCAPSHAMWAHSLQAAFHLQPLSFAEM